jgi:phosphatidylglycerophosphatase A
VALLIATGFGSGYLPWAPGTWGTVVGVGFFLALWKLNALVPGIIGGLIVSVAVSPAGERYFGKKDPGQVVVDEVVCFPLAMLGVPVTAGYLLAAFVLFRLLDVVKPPPARQIQRLPGGWGITADDVIAALYACGVIHAVRWLIGLQAHASPL